VASTIERHGRAVTGPDVDVDGVDLALTSGRAELGGLTIDNPSGYDTDYAVRIGHATVELEIGSLAGDVPVIEELTLDGASINAEQRDNAINLTDIQRHASASSADDGGREPGRIVIERFRLRDARVVLTSRYLHEPEELPLREIVVENVGAATGGATYAQAAQALLLPVIAAAQSAAAERLKAVAAAAATEALREEVDEARDEARERLEERLRSSRDDSP
jgi:uncharacterized protein involved in outer membrane biogenesis